MVHESGQKQLFFIFKYMLDLVGWTVTWSDRDKNRNSDQDKSRNGTGIVAHESGQKQLFYIFQIHLGSRGMRFYMEGQEQEFRSGQE